MRRKTVKGSKPEMDAMCDGDDFRFGDPSGEVWRSTQAA